MAHLDPARQPGKLRKRVLSTGEEEPEVDSAKNRQEPSKTKRIVDIPYIPGCTKYCTQREKS
jgi:hypothetical protein